MTYELIRPPRSVKNIALPAKPRSQGWSSPETTGVTVICGGAMQPLAATAMAVAHGENTQDPRESGAEMNGGAFVSFVPRSEATIPARRVRLRRPKAEKRSNR